LFAVLNGDPSGAGFSGNEQNLNRYGLNFRMIRPSSLARRNSSVM
jgi:hypothetical protein